MTQTPMPETLRALLAEGGASPGLFLGLDCAGVAEIAGISGIQWVVLDLEHSGVTATDVGPTVIAANSVGIPVIVRVTGPDRSEIGWMLDQGAAGVMVPRVGSAEEARAITRHFSYPPAGDRGVAGYTRAGSWGKTPLTSVTPPVCVVQIETPGALAQVDDICQIDGVDALFVGPLDLSAALGVLQEFDHPEFQKALDHIFAAGIRHGIPVGTIAGDDARAREFVDRGASFVALGSDGMALRTALTDKVSRFLDTTSDTSREATKE